MSDGTERLAEGAPDGEDRATALRVVGLLFGLLLIVGAALSLLMPRGHGMVPQKALAELFSSVDEDDLVGFEAVEAQRLPGGEVLVRWTGGGSPEELLLVRYPRKRAEAVLEDQFQSLRFDSGRGEDGGRGGRGGGPPGRGGSWGGDDGPKLQDAGRLDWHGLEARYARLRHTVASDDEAEEAEAGGREGAGSTYDTIRVNLTTADQCLVAYARFAPGDAAEVAAVEGLLRHFEPRDAAPGDG